MSAPMPVLAPVTPPPPSPSRTRLFERNRRAFRTHHPAIWKKVKAAGGGGTRLAEADGEVVNLLLDGEVQLYPGPSGGRDWTETQLAGFRDLPDRLVMNNPSHCNLSEISMAMLGDLAGWIRDQGHSSTLCGAPVVDIGFLIVFGVGLGWHVPALVEETPARHVVLIEAYPEFLYQSLSVTDWAAVFRTARKRGIAIDFVLANRPQALSDEVLEVIAKRRITFVDGSYFFCHYYSWIYREAMARCEVALKPALISTGFFEDEIAMITNASANLLRHRFGMVDSIPRREQSAPVIIVGAGPSLDKDMAELRRLADRAIVISCGTTLGILLKNGIRPHLHCENERGDLVFKLLSEMAAEHSFAGITLVASVTVDPRVPDLFDDTLFFFRPSLSSTAIFAESYTALIGPDPIVCNAALAAAVALGFRTAYLFGVDLGQKGSGRHHASDSVYFAEQHNALDTLYTKRFDRTVPGNFGGSVLTWWAFDMARQTLTWLQAATGVTLINTSDGARIEGARPKIAATIDLPPLPAPPRVMLDRALAPLRRFLPGEMLVDVDLDDAIAGCDRFVTEIEAALDAAEQAGDGFYQLEGRLNDLVDGEEARSRYRAFYFIARGTIRSMLRLGAFFGTRIADAEVRAAYVALFRDCWRQRCTDMATQSGDLLRDVRDRLNAGEPSALRRRA